MPKIETDSSNIDWAVKDGEKKNDSWSVNVLRR